MRTRRGYDEARKKFWGLPVPEKLKHGQNTWAAKVYGCSCQVCLPSGKRTWKYTEGATGPVSSAERGRRLRASKRGQPVPEGVKHGTYAHRTYYCTCEVCRGASAAASRRKKNAWRNRTRGRWRQRQEGKIAVVCWPPRDAGPDWVCPECGLGPQQGREAA